MAGGGEAMQPNVAAHVASTVVTDTDVRRIAVTWYSGTSLTIST